jgi:hypothetical protein
MVAWRRRLARSVVGLLVAVVFVFGMAWATTVKAQRGACEDRKVDQEQAAKYGWRPLERRADAFGDHRDADGYRKLAERYESRSMQDCGDRYPIVPLLGWG